MDSILHDQTAESLEHEISRLPHANVTTVPFHFGVDDRRPLRLRSPVVARRANGARGARSAVADAPLVDADGRSQIANIQWREHVRIAGRVRSIRVQPLGGVPALECMVYDGTGAIAIVFLGRRRVAGIDVGTQLIAEGRVADHHGRLAILNPKYQLIAAH